MPQNIRNSPRFVAHDHLRMHQPHAVTIVGITLTMPDAEWLDGFARAQMPTINGNPSLLEPIGHHHILLMTRHQRSRWITTKLTRNHVLVSEKVVAGSHDESGPHRLGSEFDGSGIID